MKKSINIIFIILTTILAFSLTACTSTEFNKVKDECVQIAGMVKGENNYFILDTYPEEYNNLSSEMREWLKPTTAENTLKAIKYANEELGFSGALYDKMLNTNSLMGRQTEENKKYKVSWTYHPSNGLEVTYEIK